MIILHRPVRDAFSDSIEEKLEDLVVAFNVKRYPGNQSSLLPRIEEGDRNISGKKELLAYLAELEQELNWQRNLSGDGCYIDPESGEVC